MSKAPSPRADALQAMREARYGHLQAKASIVEETSSDLQKQLAPMLKETHSTKVRAAPVMPASKPAKKRRKPK